MCHQSAIYSKGKSKKIAELIEERRRTKWIQTTEPVVCVFLCGKLVPNEESGQRIAQPESYDCCRGASNWKALTHLFLDVQVFMDTAPELGNHVMQALAFVGRA
jgi:hypothetical protein